MKIQDLLFLVVLLFLLFKKEAKLAAIAGIISLALSIPLFSFWVFFTAERLIWYAGAFFALSIVLLALKERKNRKNLYEDRN